MKLRGAEPKDSAAKVLYKRFTACERERVRKAGMSDREQEEGKGRERERGR